jgi:hypothetical protein
VASIALKVTFIEIHRSNLPAVKTLAGGATGNALAGIQENRSIIIYCPQ